ncbi:MAG: sigma-E processing peptidase SpoIIGA [Lachnospiraceae bacterium]
MTIYLDVVFFMNLLYQLGILKMLDVLFHTETSGRRIFIGAVLSSALYCGCFAAGMPIEKYPVNLAAGALIGCFSVAVTFFPHTGRKIGGMVLAECILSMCLGGILELMPDMAEGSYLMLTGSAALIFMGLFCVRIRRLLLERAGRERSIRKVRLIHKGRLVYANGLVDTGNGLVDPISKEPVMIIQKSIMEKLLPQEEVREQKGYRLIPYESIGTKKGVLEAFRLERLEILNKNESEKDEAIIRTQVICAVYRENYSTNGGYEVLLHPFLL